MDALVRFIADWLVIAIAVIGGISFLYYVKKDRYQHFARALLAGLTALVIAKIMSAFYVQGARPFVLMGVEPKAAYLENPGFPSDHALLVFTIVLVVYAATGKRQIALLLLVLSVLVAIGRVIALVHTPADVLGGILAALLGVWIWYGKELRKFN